MFPFRTHRRVKWAILGAGVGVGMLRGLGIPLLENKKIPNIVVFQFTFLFVGPVLVFQFLFVCHCYCLYLLFPISVFSFCMQVL